MSTKMTAKIDPSKLKQLQEGMKEYPFHWSFNPHPVLRSEPNGKWMVGIDYGDASMETVERFEVFWRTLEKTVVESARKPSLLLRIKRAISRRR